MSGGYSRGSATQSRRRAPTEVPAAPVSAPVTGDTRRQSAAADDKERGADSHLATRPDTARHAGLGLQNRRVQVRFLSHLPESAEFMGIAAPQPQHNVCELTRFDPYLTPPGITPRVPRTAHLVIDFLYRSGLQPPTTYQ
jgi:hypothetical protein